MHDISRLICVIIFSMLMTTTYMAQGAVVQAREDDDARRQLTRSPPCDDAYATCRVEADRRLIANGCRYCYPHGSCTINNSDACNNLRTDLLIACNSAAALCINLGK